jgi:hypothetical protein
MERCSEAIVLNGAALPCLVMTIFSNLQKMVNGGVVNHWACLNFSRSVQENVASAFCAELAHMCQTSGMVLC